MEVAVTHDSAQMRLTTETTLTGACDVLHGVEFGVKVDLVSETAALLTLMVSALVKDRNAVKVTTAPGLGDSIVFVLEVGAMADRGKIIGRQGKMAQSLRLILRSIGKENGQAFLLDIRNATIEAAA